MPTKSNPDSAGEAGDIASAEPKVIVFERYLCRAWGETDRPCVELVRDMDGVSRFMVREWLGDKDAEDDDGTPTLPRVMAKISDHNFKDDGEWAAELEIGGVSVEPVYGAETVAALPVATDQDLAEMEHFTRNFHGRAAFFPADATTLAGFVICAVDEIRKHRAAILAATPQPDTDLHPTSACQLNDKQAEQLILQHYRRQHSSDTTYRPARYLVDAVMAAASGDIR